MSDKYIPQTLIIFIIMRIKVKEADFSLGDILDKK